MVFALLILSLLLSGCSSRTEERLLERRQEFASAPLCFTARVSVLSEGAVWEFAGEVSAAGEEGELTLLAPEELREVRVSWGESSRLSYDGAVLVLPSLGTEQSPVSALPLLCRVLQRGYLLRYVQSGGCITAFYGLEDGAELSIGYDEALCPCFAELFVNGERELWMEISDFTVGTEQKNG
ncbi:MAG: hypothetical protein MJ074_08345 [Oscillospiraceae bacterium]|nr:hypothetical protein [Oscillospiraceae bacterium]